jgi:hypothetical protein
MLFAYQGSTQRRGRGDVQTPPHGAEFIHSILKHLKPTWVLDPCVGEGNLIRPWAEDCYTVGVDVKGPNPGCLDAFLQHPFETLSHKDFAYPPSLILCNPPWAGHWQRHTNYPQVFYEAIIRIFGPNIPMVFCVPMGFRLNLKFRSGRWKLLSRGPEITSIISVPVDFYPDTAFHSEILIFNVKRKIKPHYWMPEPR